jgi:hypothetical protein
MNLHFTRIELNNIPFLTIYMFVLYWPNQWTHSMPNIIDTQQHCQP